MHTSRVVIGVVFAATLLACGGGGGGGPTGPPSGSIQGTYDVDHTIVLNLGGVPFTLSCDGTLVISSVSGTTFAGTIALDPCEGLSEEPVGGPVTGTLTANGALTLELAGQDDLVGVIEDEGCTIVSADEAYAGTFSGSRIRADFDAVATCNGTPLTLHFELDARRR